MTNIVVSVVIPYSGSQTVTHTLRSLTRQKRYVTGLEVLLIAEEGTPLEGICRSEWPFLFRYKNFRRKPAFKGHSAGVMRNFGASYATGKYLMFLDSDCVAHPKCISEHLQRLMQDSNRVVCGSMHELPAQHIEALPNDVVIDYNRIKSLSLRDFRTKCRTQFRWESLYSSNFSLSKDLFRKSGGFDESGFRCHDVELGYRLSLLGANLEFNANCEVIHIEHPRSARSKVEQAKGWQLLGQKFPEISVVAQDRAIESLRSYSRTISACDARAAEISADLKGYRVENSIVVSPILPRSSVDPILRGLPYVSTRLDGGRLLHLGLHRNCWDYALVVPDRNALTSPVISVVIATHNSADTVGRAIASVLVQTVQKFEVIVVDDASEDKTVSIVDSFSRDGRIRQIPREENRGQSHSLNVGLDAVRSPLVLQLDADDWLETNALETVLRTFRRYPNTAAVYGRPFVHENGLDRRESGYQARTPLELLTYAPLQAPRAYSVDKLKEIGGWSTSDFFEGRYFEDRCTLARMRSLGSVRYFRQPVYHCERRSSSLTQSNRKAYAHGKLLILWQQANAFRKGLKYKWNGHTVTAQFVDRGRSLKRKSWSIVIPVYNRTELLKYTVRSWLESDFSLRIGELIVVDDGSDVQVVREGILSDARIRIIRLASHEGPAVARNSGARLAQHEFLFFCDSDHIVPPDVLASHERRHQQERGQSVVVGGLFGAKVATFVRPQAIDHRSRENLKRKLWFDVRFADFVNSLVSGSDVRFIPNEPQIWSRASRECMADSFRSPWVNVALKGSDLSGYDHRWLGVGGGNLSVPKALFRSMKGFDESMPPMEDWEFGARCQRTGINIVLAPEIQAIHQLHAREPFFGPWARNAIRKLKTRHRILVESALQDSETPGSVVLRSLDRSTRETEGARPVQNDLAKKTKSFSITFDDGPSATWTAQVLEMLQRHDIRGTFFLLCGHLDGLRSLCRRMADCGHEIGIHGWQHTDVSSATSREILKELKMCQRAIEDTCGVTPKYARPPFGRANAGYLDAAAQLGISVVGAHLSVRDWSYTNERDLIFELASKGFASKVLLFHDGAGDVPVTLKAIDWMFEQARKMRIKSVSLDQWSRFAPLPKPSIRPQTALL